MAAVSRWEPNAALFSTRRARVIACTLLILGSGGAWLVTQRRHEAPSLHLEERASLALPDSFDVKGGHVSPAGTTLLWAVNQSYLLLQGGARQRVLRSDSLVRPVAGTLTSGDSVVEVIDAGRRAIIRLTDQGRVISLHPLELPWSVETAVPSRSGWIVGGRDVAGNYRVVAIDWSGERTRLLTVPAKQYRGTQLSMSLSDAGGDVFGTLLRHPHLVIRIPAHQSPVEQTAYTTALAAPKLPRRRGRRAALWVALAVHALDGGFIRTFADLRSDGRVLATYDSNGRLLRASEFDVPMAVLATLPSKRLLLAARRTDRLEVVVYEWRWTGIPPS